MSDEASNSVLENDNFSKAFGEILSNPEMLNAISSMAQKLKESNSKGKAEPPTQTKEDSANQSSSSESAALVSKFPEILGLLSSNKSAGIGKNRRSDLLCALKPYLSQNRIDAIDQIIKLSELSSVFKNLS